ncbi:MAG TPA: alcohol dehydrogenase catalytic domain-containing protein [Povalibacter sp.]|uniref:zinc-binding dehydrogenase n=1 Tax=Povalibacter sp. TaxID=1962978 RepID=UPI002C469424|nr:zinc-binding dehydrogenase [Povalibacter sp.]HMN47206.1 alcohol dehydrogenase catalytic domain-containing protein [Povalibacter sp.]
MPLNVRAAVVHAPNEPFVIETLQLEGPREGEVLIHVKATGLCHSDLNVYEGKSPWQFPVLLGHEAAGVVVECGPGVTKFKPGDHVIPFLIPHCGKCQYCARPEKTNLCVEAFNRLRPRESRFSLNGKPVSQLWGLGTFADYTVLPQDTIAKVRDDAPFDPICYIGCGATTGIGAAMFAARIEPGSSVIVFGLGGIGLNVVQGAKLAGAKTIIGVDMNPAKETIARQFGATDFVNPKQVEKITSHLMKMTGGGADYTFECIGLPQVMRQAFECTNPAWGKAYVIGVAPHGTEVNAVPTQLMMGRHWTGCYMGGARLDRLPEMVDWYVDGKINLDALVTHRLPLERIGEGFRMMQNGESIRTVVVL